MGLLRRRGNYAHPVFTRCFARMSAAADRGELGARRAFLAGAAKGRVLEVGAGTGEMFKRYGEEVSRVVALEPDPHMLARARERLDVAVPVGLVRAPAERLPFRDGCFDTVVCAHVLCSVDDPDGAVRELCRVLHPSGSLLFLEHVRAEDSERLARWQDRLVPVWHWFGGGCRPNRRSLDTIVSGGFRVDYVERFRLEGMPIAETHVQGVAAPVGG